MMILRYLGPALFAMTLFVIFAPGFLACSDTMRKADAVILFVGPELESRLGEARQLIRDGYARYLIIPSYGQIDQVQGDGTLKRISGDIRMRHNILPLRKAVNYGRYFEDTHVETCEAKRIMDGLGLHTALLVSSSYHMRRIRMIAGLVFRGHDYTIICNPARWQTPYEASDWLNEERRKKIVSEYVKMAWFLVYGVVGSWQS